MDQLLGSRPEAYRCFFYPTNFSTVAVDKIRIPGSKGDVERLLGVLAGLNEPTLVYCSSPSRVNGVARAMLERGIGVDSPTLSDAADWVASNYHEEWIFRKAILKGIGIHHGRLPRSLSQFVVRAFNEERLRYLICTSTLIEGVNTKAKNVLVWDNQIAKRSLDYFTFNNICGRSGRMFEHFVGRVFLFSDPPQETLPFVDFPFFTQEVGTPDSLLIQMDTADLKDKSKDRMQKFTEQSDLTLETLRANHAIDPDDQIRLARYIEENASLIWPQLAWDAFPGYDQLVFACEIIWEYFVGAEKRQGVFSGKQLAVKIWQLYKTKNSSIRVLAELKPGKYAAKNPDDAVERVLQFERSWAGFELPRFLMALSRIQKEVLTRLYLQSGDYSAFAAQVESLFRTPVVAALDEYGIPIQAAEKIQAFLKTKDDLDTALKSLKGIDVSKLPLTAFEMELIRDSQSAM